VNTIQRYILRNFLRWLTLSFAVFIGLFYLIHFFEKVDELFSNDAHIRHFIRYLLYMTPSIATQILPVAALLAVFATLGGLSRSNELTSMSAGGMSLGQIVRPLFVSGLLLCLLALFSSNLLVPYANKRADYLMKIKIKGLMSPVVYQSENLFFRDGNQILQAASSHPGEKRVKGISIFTFDDEFALTERKDATEATYRDQQWTFSDLTVRSFSDQGRVLSGTQNFPSRQLPLQRKPIDFLERSLESSNMSLFELSRHVDKLTVEGFNPLQYRVDFHYRLAEAATSLIMVLVAVPFALQRGRYSNLSVGIVITLTLCMVYFVCQSMLLAFGYAGILPPVVAAWSTNLMFALFGSWLFLRAPS